MTRMRFINLQVRRSHLIVGFVLRRRPTSKRFSKIETFSSHSHVAYLTIRSPGELDGEVRRWVRAAYRAGFHDVERRARH
jgi:hypothetical protein